MAAAASAPHSGPAPMLVQTTYPLEYRTPPLPLVALFGCPGHQRAIADFFVHKQRPPLVSLITPPGATTEAAVARSFGEGCCGVSRGSAKHGCHEAVAGRLLRAIACCVVAVECCVLYNVMWLLCGCCM